MDQKDPNIVILAEVGYSLSGVEYTDYFSDKGFRSSSTDTPANTTYNAVILNEITTEESISISLDTVFNVSEIEIDVSSYSYINKIFKNRAFKLYWGYKNQAKSTFTQFFDGIINEAIPTETKTLKFSFVDKMLRLNSTFSETLIGGTGTSASQLIPIILGEICNGTPALIAEASNYYTYQYNIGAANGIGDVRDNGAPWLYTDNPSQGIFTCSTKPSGQITFSAQGQKFSGVYYNDCANLIKYAVTTYGKASDRFQLSDIDTTTFNNFSTNYPQPMGYYVTSKINTIEVVKSLASSIEAAVYCDRLGKLKIHQVTDFSGSSTKIIKYNSSENSIKLLDTYPVVGTVSINYCKKWTVQENTAKGIVEYHKFLFAREFENVKATDTAIINTYKLSADATPKDTMLLQTTDAQNEANRQLTFWKVQRKVFEFEGTPDLIDLSLGQMITLISNKFEELSSGKLGKIIGLRINWTTFFITIKVLV